ncbi:MAG: hypothetical protein CV045_02805 [Cyanobacteria bacterium M5B4]|nr:MAG: hypothetical protein CV045_02805 [Cyanobacteria bacterium M5B4]
MQINVREKDAHRAFVKYLKDNQFFVQEEIPLPVGRIDILAKRTVGVREETFLIEVKSEKQIKRAIGQLEVYKQHVPANEYIACLFNPNFGKSLNTVTMTEYRKVAKSLGIVLIRIEDTPVLPYLKKEIGLYGR